MAFVCRTVLISAVFFFEVLCVRPVFAVRPLSHFPVQVDGAVHGSPAVADLTGDGRREIISGTGAFLSALRDDNTLVTGFPVFLNSPVAGPVAVGIISENGDKGILAVTRNGEVFLIDSEGIILPGFPLSVGEGARAGGAFADISGDGKNEILAGCMDGKLHAWIITDQGVENFPGFPVDIGSGISSTPSFADLGGPEKKEMTILVGAADGGLHAFHVSGERREGFPVRSRFIITGQPVTGDISGNGIADIVFTSQDYNLYAVDSTGKSLPGFPVQAGYRIYGGAALIDFENDGFFAIVFAASDNNLYAVDREGNIFPGFPVRLSGTPVGSVKGGDLYRDGRQIIFVATGDRRLHAYDSTGKSLSGWPVELEGIPGGGPLLSDLVGDGFVEIIIGTRDARIAAFKSRRRGTSPFHLSWPQEGFNSRRSGRSEPGRAFFKDVKIYPSEPISTDNLHSSWTWTHPDRLPEKDVIIRWYRNNEEMTDLQGNKIIPASKIKKNEKWRFTVNYGGDADLAIIFSSQEIMVLNSPPTSPSVRIIPEKPLAGMPLKAELVEKSTDPDQDPLVYRYQWLKNDKATKVKDEAVIPGEMIVKGDRWTVLVNAYDGFDAGPVAEASVVVKNTPPGKPVISFFNDRPLPAEDIRVRIDEESTDVDGDDISYRYRWTIDGEKMPLAFNVNYLSAELTGPGRKVSVSVSAYDGEDESEETEISVIIGNYPPKMSEILISPEKPRTGESLYALISADHDYGAEGDYSLEWFYDDDTKYSFKWFADGVDMQIGKDKVPGEQVRAGQKWTVKLTAFDGSNRRKTTKHEVEVFNTPPSPPFIRIKPDDPLPGQALEAVILEPASDLDDDPVELTYVFFSDEKIVEDSRVPEGITEKGEKWVLKVVPHDGKEEGEPAFAGVRIGNLPPPAPELRIKPEYPTGGDSLKALITERPDPDGDDLSFRIRWSVNGKSVDELNDKRSVPEKMIESGQIWTLRVRATDGEDYSPVVSETVKVRPRPPIPPLLSVEPVNPVTTDTLRCVKNNEARHPDNEPFDFALLWYRNGERTPHKGESLDSGLTVRGDRWACAGRIIAVSGDVIGELSDPVEIINSPPSRPEARIYPENPKSGDALLCSVALPSFDPDGDEIEYIWSWRRNGEIFSSADGRRVPKGIVKSKEKWTCELSARDPFEKGEKNTFSVEIERALPSAPVVGIKPSNPLEGDDLECKILDFCPGEEGEEYFYSFVWFLNGEIQPFAPSTTTVLGRLADAGTVWRCLVYMRNESGDIVEGRSDPVEIMRREEDPE